MNEDRYICTGADHWVANPKYMQLPPSKEGVTNLKGVDEHMAIIIECMNKPEACTLCMFSERLDNLYTICKFEPQKLKVCDTDPIPSYCPIKEYHN